MTKIGTTGPEYTDQEIAFLQAAAVKGLSAPQIASVLTNFAKSNPGDYYPRSTPSVQVKASALGLSLATNVGTVTVSSSGHIGIRARNEAERNEWQNYINAIVAKTGASTMRDIVVYALQQAAE